MTFELPTYELYELGSQVRRSSGSVTSNIVEGYGRRRYKKEFVRFLVFAHASNDETINHLECIQLLYPALKTDVNSIILSYNTLGSMLNRFIRYVETNWQEG